MNIGLFNLEPRIVNSAMMRVSSFHKKKGDNVKLYSPLQTFVKNYDKVYCFSIFDFTSKNSVTKDMICGGTGFDLTTKLPLEIEKEDYDWSLYPKCDFSIVWFSIGCFRNCPFCVVPRKEGMIRSVEPKNLNPNGKYIKIMDNNFFANPKWKDAIEKLKEWNQPLDFQAIDARILTEEICNTLNSLRHYKQIKIAWDNPRENLVPKLMEVLQWINPSKLMCYVLIGYWSTPEEDMMRVKKLMDMKIDPFIMPYNRKDKYQRAFARWVNFKAILKSIPWGMYHQNPFKKSNPKPTNSIPPPAKAGGILE